MGNTIGYFSKSIRRTEMMFIESRALISVYDLLDQQWPWPNFQGHIGSDVPIDRNIVLSITGRLIDRLSIIKLINQPLTSWKFCGIFDTNTPQPQKMALFETIYANLKNLPSPYQPLPILPSPLQCKCTFLCSLYILFLHL